MNHRDTSMRNPFLFLCAALGTTLLISCGGGGGGSAPVAAAPPVPTSFWTMDTFKYVNGGFSSQSSSSNGGKNLTVAVISTATLAGGDQSNGAFSGSALSFAFVGGRAGTYNIVPNLSTLINGTTTTSPISVEVNVGTAVTTGSSLYAAASGQIIVTRDSAGKFRFDSLGTIPTGKKLDVAGGVAGSPPTMMLTIKDAF